MRPRTLALLALVACAGPRAGPDGAPCPTDWDGWTRRATERLIAPDAALDGGGIGWRGLRTEALQLSQPIAHCEPPAEASNAVRFVRELGRGARPDHSYGYLVDDETYLRSYADETELPALIRSRGFLDAIAGSDGAAAAVALIAEHEPSWRTLVYRSRFLTTPDGRTYGRLLVFVPGPPDRWVQLGVPDPGDVGGIDAISQVTLGVDGVPHLVDWKVDAGRLRTRVEAGDVNAACHACHKNGVISIHPLQVAEADADLLGELRARAAAYGAPTWDPLLDIDALGPTLGPSGRGRSDGFLATCAPELTRIQRARVRRKMDCERCHHTGGDAAPLNVPIALYTDLDGDILVHPETGASNPIVRDFVLEGRMPPQNDLNAAERAALYACLMLEYRDPETGGGVLADWLEGR